MPVVSVDAAQSSSAVAGRTAQYIGAIAAQQLPAAPDSLIQSQLWLVLRHFYTESTGWRAPIGPYPIVAGIQNIYINPYSQDAQIQHVLQVYLYPFPSAASNTRQWLPPATQQILTNVPGPPSSHFMIDGQTLQLQPTPDQNYGNVLYIIGTLCPTSGNTNLPDITFTHHLDGILSGLFQRLYRMPNKPWTSMELSKEYGREYKRAILDARDFAIRGQGSADIQFVFPAFGNSRMQSRTTQFGVTN